MGMGARAGWSSSPRERQVNRWRSLSALGWSLVAMAAWFTVLNVRERRESKASAAWPMTTGHISSSAVHHGRTAKGHRLCDTPEVCFAYTVEGVARTSCHAAFVEGCDVAWARTLVARYPVGAEACVWYDPHRPEAAVLEPDSWNGDPVLKVNLIFLGLSLLFALFAANRMRRIPKS